MRHHDLIVIGSGSGNPFLDARFAHLDVALVEHGAFGGTCLNVGCIPTKMLVHPADVARAVARAGHLGIDATVDKVHAPRPGQPSPPAGSAEAAASTAATCGS